MNEQDLTDLFRKLGARDPEGWARSQIQEHIPQLARFLFLRQAWRLVIKDGDFAWIAAARGSDPSGPAGSIGPAIDQLLAAGCSEVDLSQVVRNMQRRLLAGLCYLLDDPGDLEPEVAGMAWRLFQVDGSGQPIHPIDGLHESVLETESNGRELRKS